MQVSFEPLDKPHFASVLYQMWVFYHGYYRRAWVSCLLMGVIGSPKVCHEVMTDGYGFRDEAKINRFMCGI